MKFSRFNASKRAVAVFSGWLVWEWLAVVVIALILIYLLVS